MFCMPSGLLAARSPNLDVRVCLPALGLVQRQAVRASACSPRGGTNVSYLQLCCHHHKTSCVDALWPPGCSDAKSARLLFHSARELRVGPGPEPEGQKMANPVVTDLLLVFTRSTTEGRGRWWPWPYGHNWSCLFDARSLGLRARDFCHWLPSNSSPLPPRLQ